MIKTYGNIIYKKEDKHWHITYAEPHICIKLKAIFSKISKSAAFPFKFADTPETCNDLHWFIQRYPLSISDKDLSRLKRLRRAHIDNLNELEQILIPSYQPQQLSLKNDFSARNYQIVGKDVFLKCKRLLIGDEVGLGKTLIAILAALHSETLPALIVVQTHLPKQWKDEIEKFTNLKVHLVKGTTPYSLPPADIYITKYSCLAGWTNFYQQKFFKI